MNQEQFLRECGKTYPEAIAAIAYFRESVQQKCRPVIDKRISELAKVLGVAGADLKLIRYAAPDSPTSVIRSPLNLGWQAKRSDNLSLYFYLCWDREPDDYSAPLAVAISIWVKDGKKQKALVAEMDQQAENAAFKNQPWLIGEGALWMNLKEGDIPHVGDNLNRLLEYTVKFLKSVKGITKYCKA